MWRSAVLGIAVLFGVAMVPPCFSQRVIKGEPVHMGNGVVTSWVRVDKMGNPQSVGVTFPDSALQRLPNVGDRGGMPLTLFPDFLSYEYILDLPVEAAKTPFNHIVVNWNPSGHPPGFYAHPHFDFHFYMVSKKARESITCVGDDTQRVYRKPADEMIPAGYITAPMTGEGRMGCHWFDPASGEFHNHDFTKTLIYGFYDGIMNFMEPMITKAYLDSRPHMAEKINTPKRYPRGGLYYPSTYSVKYDSNKNEYTVALGGMKLR